MKENLQNLNNCPRSGVAVKEVNEVEEKEREHVTLEEGTKRVVNAKERHECIINNMNGMVRDNIDGKLPNGSPTVNRTEATKVLYKVADEIVMWGQSVYPDTEDVAKMKPKVAKELFKDICIVRGYNVLNMDKLAEDLLDLNDSLLLALGNWDDTTVSKYESDVVKTMVTVKETFTREDIKDIFNSFTRLARSKGLCTHAEWLTKALEYTYMEPDDCLGIGIVELVEPVLRYKFSMPSPLERALVIKLNRAFRKSSEIRNVSYIDTILEINEDSERMMHIQPSSRDIHEVYVMPRMNRPGTFELEYVALRTLEGYVEQGETLEDYSKVCINKGVIPETVIFDLVKNVNKNRVAMGLKPLGVVGIKGIDANKSVVYGINKKGDLLSTLASIVSEVRKGEGKRYVVYCKDITGLEDSEDLGFVARMGKYYDSELVFVSEDVNLERTYRSMYDLGYKEFHETLEEMEQVQALPKDMCEELRFRMRHNIKPCLEGEFAYIKDKVARNVESSEKEGMLY